MPEEIMKKDCLLSDLEPCERTNNNGGGGSEFNNNCGVLRLSPQECSAIFKSLKYLDKMHELLKPLETLTEKMHQQYQDKTLSMKDASMILQGIMQHGHITLEYGMSYQEHRNKDVNPCYNGNRIEHQTTLHEDSFRLVECSSHYWDNCDGEISTGCGKIYMKNRNDDAHGLNLSGAKEIECGGGVETFKQDMCLKGLAVIQADLMPIEHTECGKTLFILAILRHVLTHSKINYMNAKSVVKHSQRKAILQSIQRTDQINAGSVATDLK
ncbi:uncharacterized protein [Ptychodera flava]|uniref:uncharacterized protein n=1 Tax=Ptychodera flava TaxID=63121 RepID=UPI003969D563